MAIDYTLKRTGKFYDAGGALFNIMNPEFDIIGSGTGDVRKFRGAVAAASAVNGTVFVPDGTFEVTDTVVFSTNRCRIKGTGKQSSVVLFNPTVADKICFDFNHSVATLAGGGVLYQSGISDLAIVSTETALRKIAIRSCCTSEWYCRDVVVGPQFTGNDSIALQTQGHDHGDVRKFTAFADIPISIEDNPKWASSNYDLDHWDFTDLYLVANNNPCIAVQDGVYMTNVHFSGSQAWVAGTHGFYWVNTVDAATSIGITFGGSRWEQIQANGYHYYIEAAIQGLTIADAYNGEGNGIRLRKVKRVVLSDFQYGTTLEALNVDDTVLDLDAVSCFWQDTSTVSGIGFNQTTGMDIVSAVRQLNAAAPLPFTFHAESTVNADRSLLVGRWLEMGEVTDPAAPAANRGRLYMKDNGAGKTQVVVRFPTGAVQVIATEP